MSTNHVKNRFRAALIASLTALTPLASGDASVDAQVVRGLVTDKVTGNPVSAARVTVADSTGYRQTTAATDSSGTFQLLVDIQVDPIRVSVEALGYASYEPALIQRDGEVLILSIALDPDPLPTDRLEVTVERRKRYLDRTGFYDRAARGIGRYLTPDDLAQTAASRTADLIRRVPSIQLLADREPVFTRGGVRLGEACLPAVWVDGILLREGGKPVAFNAVAPPPAHIDAIELYAGIGSVPIQWRGSNSPCGVIVFWTRH